ncbi:MAG TPA: hypothetical protein VFG76_06470 [Candidatus Polarisedimenticolia bacterium]|nr:hypothetical protein [Candidatus Polarisedimenticolia bacterium]
MRPRILLKPLVATLLLGFGSLAQARVGTIRTVAGGGPNNLPALFAAVRPSVVLTDADGDLVFSDGRRVFRVDGTGRLTVIAGSGAGVPLGDGGPATLAGLENVSGLANDANENLYVADGGGHRVRKVDAISGVITTVAGTGFPGFLGEGGPATSAQLSNPRGLALDAAGNLFIADAGNHMVRRVDAQTGTITRVAGNGTAASCGDTGPALNACVPTPTGLAFDAAGNLYISEASHRIRKVDSLGIITTIAGLGFATYAGDGGPATLAGLNQPSGLAIDTSGGLLIADTLNNRIRRVDLLSGLISTVAGTGTGTFGGDSGPATAANLRLPSGVAVDAASGDLLIADLLNNRVRRVEAATGLIETVVGNGTSSASGNAFTVDGFPATDSVISPKGLTLDASGNIYFCEVVNHRVRRVDFATGILSTVAGNGLGGYNGDGIAATAASMTPEGLALDAVGNLYIADTGNQRVRRVDRATGIITTVAGNGAQGYNGDSSLAMDASFRNPVALAFDLAGTGLFIADRDNFRVRFLDIAGGTVITYAGNGGFGFDFDGRAGILTALGRVTGLAVDRTGNLYIATPDHSRVRKIDGQTRTATTFVGAFGGPGFGGDNGSAAFALVNNPMGLTADRDGNLYIADAGNQRVRHVGFNLIIHTVAGSSTTSGFAGDGGPAINARLSSPGAVALSVEGNLYISDSGNNRIRRVGLVNLPPVAVATSAATVECAGPDGSSVFLNGALSFDPDSPPGVPSEITTYLWFEDFELPSERLFASGQQVLTTLGLGSHAITLLVLDTSGAAGLDEVTVSVVDTHPPNLTVTPTPATLWPPNHRMIPVHFEVTATDVCTSAPLTRLVSVGSSEPDDAPGGSDGNTADDFQGAAVGSLDLDLELRAERAAAGDGRTYTVTYEAVDDAGLVSQMTGLVVVPRDQRGINEPLLNSAPVKGGRVRPPRVTPSKKLPPKPPTEETTGN